MFRNEFFFICSKTCKLSAKSRAKFASVNAPLKLCQCHRIQSFKVHHKTLISPTMFKVRGSLTTKGEYKKSPLLWIIRHPCSFSLIASSLDNSFVNVKPRPFLKQVDKLKLTGRNLGRVINFRCVSGYIWHIITLATKTA
jgi:hypothetical protein